MDDVVLGVPSKSFINEEIHLDTTYSRFNNDLKFLPLTQNKS